MRRVVWIVWIALLLAGAARAQAWQIDQFDVQVSIHPDASATIIETVIADFTGEQRHGIYRDIPVRYIDRAGQQFTLRRRLQEVTNQREEAWPYRLERAGRYQRIHISDPDRVVTGQQPTALSTWWSGEPCASFRTTMSVTGTSQATSGPCRCVT